MSKSANTPITKVNATACNAVSAAYAGALAAMDKSGDALTSICKVARAAFKGAVIDDASAKNIVSHISDARGWKRGATGDVRRSECRAVLDAYTVLPEASEELAADVFTYTHAVQLARCLRDNVLNVPKALAAYKKKTAARKKSKAAPDPVARATKWLNAMWADAKPARKRVIADAMELLGIPLKATKDESDDE